MALQRRASLCRRVSQHTRVSTNVLGIAETRCTDEGSHASSPSPHRGSNGCSNHRRSSRLRIRSSASRSRSCTPSFRTTKTTDVTNRPDGSLTSRFLSCAHERGDSAVLRTFLNADGQRTVVPIVVHHRITHQLVSATPRCQSHSQSRKARQPNDDRSRSCTRYGSTSDHLNAETRCHVEGSPAPSSSSSRGSCCWNNPERPSWLSVLCEVLVRM